MNAPYRLDARAASRRFAFTAAALVLQACNPPADSPARTDRPTLRLIDSILLQDPDSSLLADPGPYFVIDDEGRMYIPDKQSSRINRYGVDGEFELTFGRRGRGPGEFLLVGPVLLVVDTLLVVEANFQRRIHVFSTVSGKFLYSVPFAGINIWSAAATKGKLVWGHYDYNGPYTVMLADADSVLQGPIANAPALRSSQHVRPEVFKTYPELDAFSSVPLVAWADTVVFGYGPVDWLIRATLDGTAIDTFTVPVARRRGTTREGLELFRVKDFRIEDAYQAISAAVALWRSSTGEIVVWHQDGVLQRPSPNKLLISGTAWISLLSADLRRACVDANVPSPGTDRPRLALRGDTLYVFDQLMDDAASGNIRSVIRRYSLSSDGCSWRAVEHRRSR